MGVIHLHPNETQRLKRELDETVMLLSLLPVTFDAAASTPESGTAEGAAAFGLPIEIYAPLLCDFNRTLFQAKIAYLQRRLAGGA